MEINNIKEKFYEKYGNRDNQPVLFSHPEGSILLVNTPTIMQDMFSHAH